MPTPRLITALTQASRDRLRVVDADLNAWTGGSLRSLPGLDDPDFIVDLDTGVSVKASNTLIEFSLSVGQRVFVLRSGSRALIVGLQ